MGKRAVSRFGAGMLLLLSSLAAQAQSCPLCLNNVAAAKQSFIDGLRHGILVLLFPPLAICIGIGTMAYRKRNSFNEEADFGVDD